MNEQFSWKRSNDSDVVKERDEDTNSPVENSEPFVDEIPTDDTPFEEIPMGGTGSVVDPMDEMIVQHEVPTVAPVTHEVPVPVVTNAGSSTPLLKPEESEHFRTRWNEIQGNFVDEPRSAVQHADALVSEVIGQITQMFASEHSSLEAQWIQGDDVSTEDLRKALQRYRSFFNRLVV